MDNNMHKNEEYAANIAIAQFLSTLPVEVGKCVSLFRFTHLKQSCEETRTNKTQQEL